MAFDTDCVVVGAGVIGLAVARALARTGLETIVLERHKEIGSETSSRNSEVIHAGLYYEPGSLKARLCVAGRDMLYAYCEKRDIPHRRCGKLVVATEPQETAVLEKLSVRACRNGVGDLALIEADHARELEPELYCLAALHSPITGIIDTHQLMLSLQGELEAAGGAIALNSRVMRIEPAKPGFLLDVVDADGEQTTISSRQLVIAAGIHSPALVRSIPGLARFAPQITQYSRGCYFDLSGTQPFSRLIYPVPGVGELGIHATLDLAGRTRFGPDSEWIDKPDYQIDPRRADQFYRAVRRYYPALEDGRLSPAYCGIRPKIVGPEEPSADFLIQQSDTHGVDGLINLMGMESPGLTACLAIAEFVRSACVDH